MSAIFEMAAKTRQTMLNFNGIVMATGRIFSMSGINTGHHYLPTYQILMISENVDHHNTAQIQHCLISTTFHMWVDYDVPN
jgi:hypothetical protein